jgi:hypothetical protein
MPSAAAPPERVVFDVNTLISAVTSRADPPASTVMAVERAYAGASRAIVCPMLLAEAVGLIAAHRRAPRSLGGSGPGRHAILRHGATWSGRTRHMVGPNPLAPPAQLPTTLNDAQSRSGAHLPC